MYILNPYRYVSGGTHLFDNFSGAIYGFSLRKLRTAQVYGVRVQRSSDNAETDVELYDDQDVQIDGSSTVAAGGNFSTWMGASTDGYVVKWYDQSGNGNDITQSTISVAPKIWTTSAIYQVTHTGFRTALRNPTTGKMSRSALTELADGQTFTIFTVVLMFSFARGNFSRTSDGTGSNYFQHCSDLSAAKYGCVAVGSTTTGLATISVQDTSTDARLTRSLVDGGNKDVSYWKGGTAEDQNQAWTGTYTNDTFFIGFQGDFVQSNTNGAFLEIIAFSGDKTSDAASIESNIETAWGLPIV